MKDPHQWSTVTCNDRFFILLAMLVSIVFLLPVAMALGLTVGLVLDILAELARSLLR
jgi:hypothetical protein